MITDEPTSGLDPQIRNEITDIFMDIMKYNSKSIFYSTHITSDLDKTADEIILINKGEIILSDSKDNAIRECGMGSKVTLEDVILSKIKE